MVFGRPDALEPLTWALACPVWLLSLSTLRSPWASLFILLRGYFGMPEGVCFNVGKFINFFLCVMLGVFSENLPQSE